MAPSYPIGVSDQVNRMNQEAKQRGSNFISGAVNFHNNFTKPIGNALNDVKDGIVDYHPKVPAGQAVSNAAGGISNMLGGIQQAVQGGASGGGYGGGGSSASGGGGGVNYDAILSGYRDIYAQQQAEAEAYRQRQQAALDSAYGQMKDRAKDSYAEIDKLRQDNYDYGAQQVNQAMDKAQQEAYISRMMQERNLGQQLSALGKSGGASESTLLGLANAYGSQRGENERTRSENLASLLQQLNAGRASDKTALNDLLNSYEASYLQGVLGAEQDYNQMLSQIRQEQAAQQLQLASQLASSRSSTGSGNDLNKLYANLFSQFTGDDGMLNRAAAGNYLDGLAMVGGLSDDEYIALWNAVDVAGKSGLSSQIANIANSLR